MEITHESDYELIRGMREKNQASLVLFIERYQDKVLRMAYVYSHSWHDAEEIAQEVFVKIYERVNQFRGDAKISTWLYRIAANESVDFLRRKKSRGLTVPLASKVDNEEGEVDIASRESNARELSIAGETSSAIDRAVEKLPDKQRHIFTLFYLQGLKIDEIAAVLEVSVGNIKAQLWQAREKMKRELAPIFNAPEGRMKP